MNFKKFLSNILFVAGLCLMLISIGIAFAAKNNDPQILMNPSGARKTAEKMLTAICSGDYTTASSFMYGNPSLGAEPENASLAVELIWTAFLEGAEYEISGDCYVSESGVSVDITLRTLDVAAVIDGVERNAKELLNWRVAAARDVSELYDDDNNFHQEIIDQVLRDATLLSLTDKTYQDHAITLDLVFEQGEWWVLPNDTLQHVLSGSF